ncbi:myc box-dependent-interacting protein 1-like isoform X2 [Dinothrombium tinctorium]|uniref:Myc box-dependent-interacting protein 1-like isoform X2 n=1 Tax=Dinothrombium tinctorium TaxID=1965070 RepID=A0A3S3PG60_9ACAR|nr:myc box-dependent-interacting protein 1-like isoform X2 [Dinothrombium tinctorium]
MVYNMAESKGGSFSKVVRKKAGRAKERLLQNLGKADRTTDELFEVYQNNFNKQQNSATRLQKELKNYVTCIRAMQAANKGLMECLIDIYEPEWPGHEQIPVKAQTLELLWEELCHKLNDQVTIPLSTYLSQFSEIRAKIEKRGRKLVDYDGCRHTMESLQSSTKKRDEIKIAKAREQMEEARRLYEVLNKELHDELPALYDSRIPFLISTLQTLFASETTFHSEYSKTFAQFSDLIDALAIEAQKGSYHMSARHLPSSSSPKAAYKPDGSTRPYEEIDYQNKNPESRPNSGVHKITISQANGIHGETEGVYDIPVGATTTDLPPGVLYKVRATYKYVAEDTDELAFEAGEVIDVVPYEDPEEQEEGWLLGIKESDGQKGLFPANFTRPI